MANDERTSPENAVIVTENVEQDKTEYLSDDESRNGQNNIEREHDGASNDDMMLSPAKLEEELGKRFCVVNGKTITGFIYFITNGKFVKIGSAENVLLRLTDLQISTPDTLKVLFTIPLLPETKRGGTYYSILNVEKYLHGIFKPFNYRGEWFDIHDVINVYAWRNYFGTIMTPGSTSTQEYAIVKNRRETQKHIEKVELPADRSGYESIEKRITGLEYKLDSLFSHLETVICFCTDDIKSALKSSFSRETDTHPEDNKKVKIQGTRLLTTNEAAEMFGLSAYELRNGFKQGIYRAIAIGSRDSTKKRLRWRSDQLKEDIEKKTKKEDAE